MQETLDKIEKATTIREVATVINSDWKKPYFGAVPYLEAMSTLTDKNSMYICDSASSIVNYFLANATTYKGEVARKVKEKLKKLIK